MGRPALYQDTEEYQVLKVTIPKSMHERIKKLAEQEDRPMSMQVNRILREYFDSIHQESEPNSPIYDEPAYVA